MKFNCPHCQKALNVKDEIAGKKGKCPSCGGAVTIPEPEIGVLPDGPLQQKQTPPQEQGSGPSAFGEACPKCFQSMAADAVVCIQCGYDTRTKKTLRTEFGAEETQRPDSDATGLLKPTSSSGFRPEGSSLQGREAVTRLFKLGLIILLGFFLPIAVPMGERSTRLIFPNLLVLGQKGAPLLAVLFFLYPALAGVAVILLAVRTSGTQRAVGLIAAGVLPILILLPGPGVLAGLERLVRSTPGPAMLGPILLLVGWVGIYVGSRTATLRPGTLAAALIATIGGGSYLLFLVFPFIPAREGLVPLLAVLKLFFTVKSFAEFLAVLGLFALMACMGAAAAFCVQVFRERPSDQYLGYKAFSLLRLGSILCPVLIFLGALLQVKSVGTFAVALTVAAKLGCWGFGLFLLIPIGLTELVVALVSEKPKKRTRPSEDKVSTGTMLPPVQATEDGEPSRDSFNLKPVVIGVGLLALVALAVTLGVLGTRSSGPEPSEETQQSIIRVIGRDGAISDFRFVESKERGKVAFECYIAGPHMNAEFRGTYDGKRVEMRRIQNPPLNVQDIEEMLIRATSLSQAGKYQEALNMLEEARRAAKEQGIWPVLMKHINEEMESARLKSGRR